jgi:transcriptional regulator with PAS, ATPase and Fis domain
MANNIVLEENKILEMFQNIDVSIAVFDRDMNMVYMNERAKWFYNHVFGANDILGKNVKECHEAIHIKNIEALLKEFDAGKPLNFFHADPPMIEGGHLSVIHYPYMVNGKVEGIMEINVESSLTTNGRGEYKRVHQE